MPLLTTLGEALRVWRVRRNWQSPEDLANGLINDGFAADFAQYGLAAPDTDELTGHIASLESGEDWPWLSEDIDMAKEFASHCAHCLRLSKSETKDLEFFIARCFGKSIHP